MPLLVELMEVNRKLEHILAVSRPCVEEITYFKGRVPEKVKHHTTRSVLLLLGAVYS